MSGIHHVQHQYVVRTPQRDSLKNYLREQGIGSLIHYSVPVHLQPAYAHFTGDQSLIETEKAAHEILSLPLYPELTDDQIEQITESILDWDRSAH